jgi:serine phosphatase RsbU (regulator of sigma subunit)/anti-sigma regulatory factor (Ser/Thr protein kinase)
VTQSGVPVVRRLTLPAELRSPGAARSLVRSVAAEAGLDDHLDEALLLTTELVTNAVLHAGTELTVEVLADASGLTITVLDGMPGPLPGTRPAPPGANAADDPEAERGRGLLLVDGLAARWGTVHHPGGKGVWFHLPGRHASLDGLVPWPAVDPMAVLGTITEGAELPEQLEELLRRVAGATGAGGGAVLVDDGEGAGPRALATCGAAPPVDGAGTRVPLRLTRPWRGELVLYPARAATVHDPLVTLAAERIGLLLENHRLRRADLARRGWLTFLAEAGDLLAQSLDVELTLALIPRLVVPRLGLWCAVHMLHDDGELRLAVATHSDESAVPKLVDLLDTARPLLLEALGLSAPVPLVAPAEGIAVALVARGQQIGTIAVGRDPDGRQGPDEIAAIEDFARRAAVAVDNNRIHAERRAVATELQRSLLPPQLPRIDGIDLGAEYVPAAEAVDVGGDFYDIVSLPGERWLIVIGDVSGKGVQAAIVTGLVRDVTRALVRDGRPVAETLARLNETLVERGGGRFCTLALAVLSRRPDGLVDAALHLAGHEQTVLVHADGRTRLVGRCGTALGLLPTVKSPVEQVVLLPGDMLIFSTDGVTERRHRGVLFGIDRLRNEASTLAGFPADVVAARLRTAAVAFSPDPPRDDIAVLTVRIET